MGKKLLMSKVDKDLSETRESLLPKEEEKKAEPLKQSTIGELFMYT